MRGDLDPGALRARGVEDELAPIVRPPVGIEIEDQAHASVASSPKRIEVSLIERSGFVEGVMGLNLFEIKKERLIEILLEFQDLSPE